ncbi:alpha/beta hydrolase [Mycolicibacterium celeriflavum]|uniref:alpha/beta hydrolase n=1 Tax=Mycolicibacterium celeriflavum TaxID=1249101 RepID=UPI0009F5106B|nr:alpha/beta hydrolase [Mycolicibacterium celeriflavum]ORA50990.1 alpha/beta hydrolase [Mycolicibacterium celeriflavum]
MERNGASKVPVPTTARAVAVPSPASRALFALSSAVMRPVTALLPSNALGVCGLDAILRIFLAATSAPRRGLTIAPVDTVFGDRRVRGEWVCAPGVDPDGAAVLYIHGGAFVACSPRTHRGLIGELSASSGRPVFAVEYRKAPRHRFPCAADDALAAYEWLTSAGRAVAVAGDSAGGQLAVATTLAARRHGLPDPAAVLLYSPALDLTGALALALDGRRRDAFAPARRVAPTFALYVGDADPCEELLSVLDADVAGFPPTMIHVGSTEMLLDDSRRLAQCLRDAGVAVDLHVARGQIHVFPAMFRFVPEARTAIRHSGTFLADHLAPGAARAPFSA